MRMGGEGVACEGRGDEKKRTLSDRRIQGNGKINFHGSQFLHFFSFLPSPCTGFVRRV